MESVKEQKENMFEILQDMCKKELMRNLEEMMSYLILLLQLLLPLPGQILDAPQPGKVKVTPGVLTVVAAKWDL